MTSTHRCVRLCVEIQCSYNGELAGSLCMWPCMREHALAVHRHAHKVPQPAVLAFEGGGQLLGQGELEREVVGARV